jgi:transglutaminase-like putative cysteine protease
MRFNMQEISGSRARLRYSVVLEYLVEGHAEFLLNIHVARTRRQNVVEEFFSISPQREISLNEDEVTGNRLATFNSASGKIVIRYEARVEIEHRIMDPDHIFAHPPSRPPLSALRYLYPSRFCQADLVQQQAWDRFGKLPRGYSQVRAIRDWVQTTLKFQVGTSSSSTSAIETLRDGAGVCRDFAHTMIAYCRALNYPARFVTGVDFGADAALGPTDFHAYVEVYVGDDWYLFDPTGISPVTGLLRIGTGRDAADASFATIFGPVRTGMPRLSIAADEDLSNGFSLPVHTDLAVSTAD